MLLLFVLLMLSIMTLLLFAVVNQQYAFGMYLSDLVVVGLAEAETLFCAVILMTIVLNGDIDDA